MKQLIFIFSLMLCFLGGLAQETPPTGPTFKQLATSQFWYNTADGSIWQYKGATYGWERLARYADLEGLSSGTFTEDVVVNAGPNARIGKYTNGQTIPAAGKTVQEFLFDIATATIAPTYSAPTASITGAPSAGTYEIGSVLNLTFSSSFNQNNGGAATSTTYRKSGSPLASNTDAITLTSSVSYDVQKTYAQGACLNNNLGVPDCTGRIEAGTATSGAITYSVLPKRYWGRSSGAVPTNAEILAAAGGESALSNSKTGTFSVTASGSNYAFFSYPESLGDVSDIKVGGLSVVFNKTVASFTNASGYTQNYIIMTTQNATSGDVTMVIN